MLKVNYQTVWYSMSRSILSQSEIGDSKDADLYIFIFLEDETTGLQEDFN